LTALFVENDIWFYVRFIKAADSGHTVQMRSWFFRWIIWRQLLLFHVRLGL